MWKVYEGFTGCGAVVARAVRDGEVGGSNPPTPTLYQHSRTPWCKPGDKLNADMSSSLLAGRQALEVTKESPVCKNGEDVMNGIPPTGLQERSMLLEAIIGGDRPKIILFTFLISYLLVFLFTRLDARISLVMALIFTFSEILIFEVLGVLGV